MKTLTLDLGTHTGWVIMDDGSPLVSGTIHLATDEELKLQRREGRERTLDVRFVRIHGFISEHVRAGVERIVFEDVEFASTRMQAQLWTSLRTAIWSVALLNPNVRIFGLPVATLKQFATGNGHVQKLEMAQALAKLLPDIYRLEGDAIRKPDGILADHNEVDAIWLALYAQAVDRGARSFLGLYQRKQLRAAERKKRRAERRQAAKVVKAAARAKASANRALIREAIRSLGRCCGVLRKQRGRWAVCPKCDSKSAIPKRPSLADAPTPERNLDIAA
jgi:Holliday junction resolvasome RuvABC endonuclease subunit